MILIESDDVNSINFEDHLQKSTKKRYRKGAISVSELTKGPHQT